MFASHEDALISLQGWAETVLGVDGQQTWHTDWKIWCGSVMYCAVWFKWLRFGYRRSYYIKALHVLSFDLVILHVLQFNQMNGWMCMFLLIMVQNILASKIFYREKDLLKKGEFKAHNIYSAVSEPFMQACFVLFGQFLFMGFYFYALMTGLQNIRETGKYNYLFWMVAYIAVQMSNYFNRGKDSQLGEVMDIASAAYIWKNIELIQFSYIMYNGEHSKPFSVSRALWSARCVMDFLVNMTIRDLIAFTVPVLLMSFHDPLNCVVYSVCIDFIATMDDCTEINYFLSLHDDAVDLELEESTQLVASI